MTRPRRSLAGFTLIEAVIAITITGIIGAMVAVFIGKPVEGYVSSVRRAELSDTADVALRRMTRDIRLALPNSLRVMETNGATTTPGTCQTAGYTCYIEFIMTSGGGRYRDPADGSTGGDFLSFTSTSDKSFHVLGKSTNAATGLDYIGNSDYIVVYNLGPGYAPADAYSGGNRAQVDATVSKPINCDTPPCIVTLTSNPFSAQSPPLPSPGSRFQIVPGSERAVTYSCPVSVAGNLNRIRNYGFNANQAVPSGGTTALLAGNATCAVEYTNNATGRNGLLYLRLTLGDGQSSPETVTLFNQIHIDNSP